MGRYLPQLVWALAPLRTILRASDLAQLERLATHCQVMGEGHRILTALTHRQSPRVNMRERNVLEAGPCLQTKWHGRIHQRMGLQCNNKQDKGLESQEDSPHHRVVPVIVNIDSPYKPGNRKVHVITHSTSGAFGLHHN